MKKCNNTLIVLNSSKKNIKVHIFINRKKKTKEYFKIALCPENEDLTICVNFKPLQIFFIELKQY